VVVKLPISSLLAAGGGEAGAVAVSYPSVKNKHSFDYTETTTTAQHHK